MGRHSCCQKQKLRKGLWSPEEDEKLVQCIASYGHGCWSNVPKLAGLERCGKSCRLRWKNYLRPDLKRGAFSSAEEKLIIDLHAIVGNRWSQIASQLPGRTDNEVKNFWNSCIKKKLKRLGIDPKTHKPIGSMTQNQTDQQANGASADSESPETSTDLNQQQSQGYKSVAESSGSESYNRLNYMQCHEQGKMVSMNNEERACAEDSNTSNVDARLGWMLHNNAQSFSPEEGMIERFSFSKAPPVQAVHSFPEQQGPMLMLAGAPFNPNGVMAYLHGHGGPHLQVSPFDDSSGCRPVFQLEPKLGLYSSPSARNHELQFTPIFNSDSLPRAPEISRPSPPPLPPRLQIFEDHNPGRQIEGPSFMVMDDFGISRGVARGNCYVKSETLDNNAVVVQEPSGWQYHIKNGVNEWQVCSPSDLHRIAAALDQI